MYLGVRPRQSWRPLLAGAVALAAVVTARAADDKPVTLVRVFKPGQEYHYSTTGKARALGNDMQQTETDRVRLKEIRPNGDAVFESGIVSGSYTLNGKQYPLPPSPPITVEVDRRDRLVSVTQAESFTAVLAPEVRQLLIAAAEAVFPEKPVAVNDSWDTALDNPAVKARKVQIRTTFLGPATVDGHAAWKLTQHLDADADATGDKMAADVTFWLDPTDGHPLRYDTHYKGVPTQVGIIDMESSATEVPADATKAARP